jgi:hypothetical protein
MNMKKLLEDLKIGLDNQLSGISSNKYDSDLIDEKNVRTIFKVISFYSYFRKLKIIIIKITITTY